MLDVEDWTAVVIWTNQSSGQHAGIQRIPASRMITLVSNARTAGQRRCKSSSSDNEKDGGCVPTKSKLICSPVILIKELGQ